MLRPIITQKGDEISRLSDEVRFTDRLTDVFRCRMEQLEAVHRWLAGYFQAVAIMLQIPGAAAYRWIEDETDDDLWDLIWNPDTAGTLNVLAAALERLDAGELLRQVPGGDGVGFRAPFAVTKMVCEGLGNVLDLELRQNPGYI